MISANNVTLRVGKKALFEDVNIKFTEGNCYGMIGANGAGKSTFLKILSGQIEPTKGEVNITPGERLSFLQQDHYKYDEYLVLDTVIMGNARLYEIMKEKEVIYAKEDFTDEDGIKASELEAEFATMNGWEAESDAATLLNGLGIETDLHYKYMKDLKGAEKVKVLLAQALFGNPDILLLDEPTNHLDIAAVEWLENYLKSYENAVIIVSHDRMFLDRVIDVTYEIEYGDIKRYPGNYSAFVKQKEEAQIKQEKDYEAQQKEIERLTAWIEKWKNTPTKVAATRSKRMAIEHMVKIEKPRRFDTRTFHALFHPVRESYTDVLTMKKLKIGYDTVLSEVSAVIKKAERIVIIGENGKGKSTLLKTVVGEINPLGGSYQFGNRVDFAYFDQHKAVNQKFDPEQTVLDYFWSLYPNLLRNDVRSALGAFLFSGEDVEKKMGQLSGGEKVRLELCRIFYTKPNFLILDEPTNHMDLAGKEALEKMLTSYEGTVLFVSHDRYFINQVATGILEFGESDVQFYEMNYAQYLEEIKRQTPGRETGNAGGAVRKPADVPTLDDVFDKKKYYNPGKILSRLKRQLEKYEEQLAESESRMSELQLEMMDPELSADYERLMELQTKIDEENQTQESLLERMMETELELEEMETQDE